MSETYIRSAWADLIYILTSLSATPESYEGVVDGSTRTGFTPAAEPPIGTLSNNLVCPEDDR